MAAFHLPDHLSVDSSDSLVPIVWFVLMLSINDAGHVCPDSPLSLCVLDVKHIVKHYARYKFRVFVWGI